MASRSPFERAYAVIMAGGSGTRFWPLSRRKHPKQLLELFGRRSLLEQTMERIHPALPPERIFIFTNQLVRAAVRRVVPQVPAAQIIAEPAARNTAPTIGLAAHEIARKDPEAVMIVLPSDHVITRPESFLKVLRAGCQVASSDGRSVVVGLKPTRPETGYGYIQLGAAAGRTEGQDVFKVKKFTEKPPLPVARRYVASGRYLWNSGMFIWRVSTLLRNLERVQPGMARGLARIDAAGGARAGPSFRRLYPRIEKISIDYALMEHISDIFAVPADIGWSDVGSWAVVYELKQPDAARNVRPRSSLCLNSRGNMIVAPDKAVVTVGVEDLVIVETSDALLVCAREHAQEVGKAVQELERRGLTKLL